MIRGRSLIAAFAACAILLLSTETAFPTYNTEAGHKYTVACQRLADLRKSPKKKKYRSYWMDCIRTFEMVEKKYPRSPSAGDACFDRAGVYQDLYQFNKFSKDLEEAIRIYGKCQTTYPKHTRAPEALYRVIELAPDYKKDNTIAASTFAKLWQAYPDSTWTGKARELLGTTTPPPKKKRKKEPELRNMPAPVIASAKGGKPEAVVKSIRYWSGGAYTRIVIDQDRPIRFLTQELKNPDRLVFDLYNTRLDPSIDKDPLPVNDGILRQVRSRQHAPDIVRVVLDLASIKSYAAFPLHDPDRLVIDVTGEEGRTPEPVPATAESVTQQEQQQQVESAVTETQAAIEPPAQASTQPTPTLPPAIVRRPETPRKSYDPNLSLSRQLGLKIKTIAIDAGHGGHDPGAIGRSGLREKTITLDVAKRLAVLVKERLGVNVIMTRDRDIFIPLEERPFIAKSKGADLFVSIHVNANRKKKARGIETYIQSLRASDRDAMATAARENAMSTKKLSELKSELDRIFADLTRDDKLEESLQLAHAVQGSLVDTVKPIRGQVVNLGVKRAFFYVLINTEMPSILAEVGFISNPDEEKLLRTESYRQAIAEALYQGVKKYVDSRSPQMMGI